MDPYEWGGGLQPKTFDRFRQWGVDDSKKCELKSAPCSDCDLQWVCGGINKTVYKINKDLYGNPCVPQVNTGIDRDDFYFYRKHNYLTFR